MIRTVGLIGSGNVGSSLARLAVAAGLDVVLSNSRGRDSLADLIADLGDQARAASPAEAAESADIVVVAVPLSAYTRLPVDALTGKTVIDAMNYLPERFGHIEELDAGGEPSSALVQRHLSGSRVVKAFNNVDALRLLRLARPAGAADRSALPVAGDDPAAKEQTVALLDLLGFDAVDAGTLADSWRTEPGSPVHVSPYLPERPEGLDQQASYHWYLENPGIPVSASRVKELLQTAVQGD